jgi:hypothetical protein
MSGHHHVEDFNLEYKTSKCLNFNTKGKDREDPKRNNATTMMRLMRRHLKLDLSRNRMLTTTYSISTHAHGFDREEQCQNNSAQRSRREIFREAKIHVPFIFLAAEQTRRHQDLTPQWTASIVAAALYRLKK